jgi:hypothetical protein
MSATSAGGEIMMVVGLTVIPIIELSSQPVFCDRMVFTKVANIVLPRFYSFRRLTSLVLQEYHQSLYIYHRDFPLLRQGLAWFRCSTGASRLLSGASPCQKIAGRQYKILQIYGKPSRHQMWKKAKSGGSTTARQVPTPIAKTDEAAQMVSATARPRSLIMTATVAIQGTKSVITTMATTA